MDFSALVTQCAPSVAPQTMMAIARTESGFNPFAIGVVDGYLVRQPTSLDEAVATVKSLEAAGFNYSMGIVQVNKTNLQKYGLDITSVFDTCKNLAVGAKILGECYNASVTQSPGDTRGALLGAISCYYSGNSKTGFAIDAQGTSYVSRVLGNAQPTTTTPAAPDAIPIRVIATKSTNPTSVASRQNGSPSVFSKFSSQKSVSTMELSNAD